MKFQFTAILPYISAGFLLVTSACQKAKLPEAAGPQNKSEDSLSACNDLNLARDASWTAGFLRKFVSCASIQDDQDKGSLDHSLQLIDAMGEQRLQDAMDLMLSTPVALTPSNPSVYPNLNALITFMDRGVHNEKGVALVGTENRWDALQTTLEKVRPRPLLQLLVSLEDAGVLDSFIQELLQWSDSLPKASLAGVSHLVLTHPELRQDIQVLQSHTIYDKVFYARLKQLWQPSSYPWISSPIDCTKGSHCEAENKKSFFGHAQDFWSKATLEQQKRWSHTLAAFLRMGLETQIDELLRRTHDLYELFRSYALRQKNFLVNTSDLIGQLLNTPLSDLDPAMRGLNQIKDNPSYRDAFEEKVGSTYLHELVEDFIWDGAKLQSCSQEFAGLKTQTDVNQTLQTLLRPQASCQGRIPLLLYLDETLGLNCRTGACAQPWVHPMEQVSIEDLSRLAHFAWIRLEQEVTADPYSLKNRQLGLAPMDTKNLALLKEWWMQHIPQSAAELVRFDQELAADSRFERLLKKDFLEAWYSSVLQKLNTIPDEFRDIWPDQSNPEAWYQKNIDIKLQRVGLGLYAFGPLDQAFASSYPLNQAFRDMDAALPGVIDAANFSQILSPTREIASQIKNPLVSMKPETEKISYELPGSIALHRAYAPNGSIPSEALPFALQKLSSEAGDGWALLSRYRDQLPLLTAAADPSRAKALEAWIAEQYLPRFSQLLEKAYAAPLHSLPVEFFNGESLTAEDVRLFTLFAAQSWLSIQAVKPAAARISALPVAPTFSKERAPQVFLGIPGLSGSSQTWNAFWAFNGGSFQSSKKNLQDILNDLPKEGQDLKAYFLQLAQNPQVLTQGRLNVIDRDKISAHEKLLLQLQSMSSLYKSRGLHQLVPSVGFDAYCLNGQGTGDCPFTVANFDAYRRYLEERILQNFCPFVAGSQFSSNFQQTWRDALGFQDSPENLTRLCSKIPAAAAGSVTPATWENNWLTLIKLGRNPRLKTSLQQFPEAIRLIKIKDVQGPYQRFVRFYEVSPLWIPTASARLQQREGVYTAFRWHAPGMIDHILAAYTQEVGDKTFSDALKKLGRWSTAGGNPVYDLIQAVTDSYAASQAAQENTTSFILRIADRISQDPQLIQTTSRLLEKPEDPFAGILLAFTFPQAMKVGVFEDFAWDHPSYKLMRLAFQSENRRLLLGLVAAFDRLSPKLWKIYQDAASAYPDRPTMVRDVETLLNFSNDAMRSAEQGAGLSALWQNLLAKPLPDESFRAFIHLFHQMREPLVDLNNEWQPTLMSHLDEITHASLQSLWKVALLLEQLPADQSLDLFKKAWQGLSPALLQNDGQETWSLMQDKRLGLGDSGILTLLLRDPDQRLSLRLLLKAAWNLEASWVLAATEEWEAMAVSTQKVLHYFEKNVQWRGPGAASYQYFIKTLDHQLEDGQKRMRDQLQLIRQWVRPEEQSPCAGGVIAC